MRAILTLLLMLPVAVQGQPSDQRLRAETDSLYAIDLGACIEAQVAAYAAFSPFWRDSSAMIVVEENASALQALPSNLGNRRVQYITQDEVRKRATKGRPFTLFVSRPIHVSGRTLRVSFSDYTVQPLPSSRHLLSYAMSGGCHAYFEFDGTGLRFTETDLWGI